MKKRFYGMLLLTSLGSTSATASWKDACSWIRDLILGSGGNEDGFNPYEPPQAENTEEYKVLIGATNSWDSSKNQYVLTPQAGKRLPADIAVTSVHDGKQSLAKDIDWDSEETSFGATGWSVFTHRKLVFEGRKKGFVLYLSLIKQTY